VVCQECGRYCSHIARGARDQEQIEHSDCFIESKICQIREFDHSTEGKERVRFHHRMEKSADENVHKSNLPTYSDVDEFNRLETKWRDLVVEGDTLKKLLDHWK